MLGLDLHLIHKGHEERNREAREDHEGFIFATKCTDDYFATNNASDSLQPAARSPTPINQSPPSYVLCSMLYVLTSPF